MGQPIDNLIKWTYKTKDKLKEVKNEIVKQTESGFIWDYSVRSR